MERRGLESAGYRIASQLYYFLVFLYFFYWTIIDQQYYIGFRCAIPVFDNCIHSYMLTMVSIVTLCNLEIWSLYLFIPFTYSTYPSTSPL